MENPFMTAFGREPDNYIPRLSDRQIIVNSFTATKPKNHVYLISGARGSGKTVFLANILDFFRTLPDWLVCDPGIKTDLSEMVAASLLDTALRTHQLLPSELDFSFHGRSISLNGREQINSVFALFQRILDVAKSKGKRVLIAIDEIEDTSDAKDFIELYQTLRQQGYQLMLLLTGIYENIRPLRHDPILSFLYRSPTIYLSPLSTKAITDGYRIYLGSSKDQAKALAALTKGYAFGYQLLGEILFDSGKREDDIEALAIYDEKLFEMVYGKVLSELSRAERNIVFSMGPQATGVKGICSNLGISNFDWSAYQDRLTKMGIIQSTGDESVEFALPRFFEFIEAHR